MPTGPSGSAPGQFDVLDVVVGLETEHLPEEGQLELPGETDALGAVEAVALPLELDVRVWDAVLSQLRDHPLGLLGRDHRVVLALEQEHRGVDAVGVVGRRALPVELLGLRIGADQPVEVVGLELVGVLGQRPQVRDAVVAGAGVEGVVERKRRQDDEPAGAAAPDCQTVAVDTTLVGEVAGDVDAVLDAMWRLGTRASSN